MIIQHFKRVCGRVECCWKLQQAQYVPAVSVKGGVGIDGLSILLAIFDCLI